MTLGAGTRLGPYEILAPLGAGGMGEVYRARDSRLAREVAVKVLPQHLSASPEVRARFEREARTVSSLNHPHICTLHDVGREGETDYLVMELVEGETLAARLLKGALPTADVLKIGMQIADALDRAHRAGVIHRDLKPGNVMLTKSGAKLMDFGLARATGLAGPAGGSAATLAALTQSPTVAAPLTAEGTIVGTFQYMAPEQLEGKEADARSDLWGLGCVLYEMATGVRAFEGKSQASLISAIMSSDPAPISRLAPMAPPALERVVAQCLAKDPDERWQNAGDLGRELEWIRAGSSGVSAAMATAAAAPRASRRVAMIGILGGAAIAIAALALAWGPWRAQTGDERLIRLPLAAPAGTTWQGPAEAALSPDGQTLVFTAADSAGNTQLYVRSLGAAQSRAIPGTERGNLAFWSPEGRVIGFFAGGKLKKVALDGSAPVVLCDAPDPRGGDWSRDDVILFAPNNQGPISRVSGAGGTPVPVTRLDARRHEFGHRYPQWLPDGKHFLYVAIGQGSEYTTYVASRDGGAPTEICRAGSAARYAAPGYLLFLDRQLTAAPGRLLARRFDAAKRRASGDPVLVLDGVNSGNLAYPNVTTDDRGTLVVQHWGYPHFHLDWRDRSGTVVGVAAKDLELGPQALSPDGRRLACLGFDVPDLWVVDLESGVSKRLTFENSYFQNAAWSDDGKRIAFARLVGGTYYEIHVKAADGSGPDSLVFRGSGLFTFPLAWSRDGRWLVAACSDSAGGFDLWRVPMAGQGTPSVYERTPENETTAAISPDGRWLTYTSSAQGKSTVYVESFPEPGTKNEIAAKDAVGSGWSWAGDQLLYGTAQGELFSVQVTTSPTFEQGASRRLFTLPAPNFLVGVVPGEQRFLSASVDPHVGTSELEIVLNWPRLLDKK